MLFRGFMALTCLMLVTTTPVSAQTATTPIVIGQSHRLTSAALGEIRTVNVSLPASYAKTSERYPVVYLLDGGLEQDFHHITGLAQLGALSGTMRDMIVVGIETVDRRKELTGPTADATLKAEFPTAGGAAAFRRFIVEEVKPFVAATYRTTNESGIIGESLAGLFVVETFLRTPGAFDRYIAVSPSLWWDNEALSREADALLPRDGANRALWLSIGDEGGAMQAGVDRLVAALKARAPVTLDWRYEPRHDQTHATIFHGVALEALRAFYPKPVKTE